MDTRALVAAYNSLGQRLYERLAAQHDGNIVLSPVSIGTVLAMALSGARGATEQEMRAVLGHAIDRATMEAASGALLAELDGYNHAPHRASNTTNDPAIAREAVEDDDLLIAARQRFEESSIIHIAFANALLLTDARGGAVMPAYQERIGRSYAAEVLQGASLDDVNAWGSARTMGRVPHLLTTVDPNAVAYLLNAMLFVASWKRPFDATQTRPASFALADGSRVEVQTMHQTASFPIARGDGWRALRLGCKPRHLALIVGLPEPGRALQSIDPREIARLAVAEEGWTSKRTALALPRFAFEAASALVDPLKRLGMVSAFDEDRADFGDIAAAVHISQVRHGATIEVNETGIAATATTVVEISERSPAEPFEVDRPFLFVLADTRTGAVLMQGRMVDPAR